jgi:dephospho-CoA kinase
MKIIGAVGRNGSGKDEVLIYLKSVYDVPFLSTGDIVRSIAVKEGVEPTRENLGKISERYFDELGKGCFVKMLADKLKQSGWPVAGITGIRSFDDVTILTSLFGKDFVLFCVYVTNPELRFARMVRRAEGRDPVSYAQFVQQEEHEEKLFKISEAESYVDYSLSNDTSLEDLHRQIDDIVIKNMILKT